MEHGVQAVSQMGEIRRLLGRIWATGMSIRPGPPYMSKRAKFSDEAGVAAERSDALAAVTSK